MKKMYVFSSLTTAALALLSACGGGDDLTIGAITTGTPGPTATNTNTPVPTATATATRVPGATNTPVPVVTNTPVPVNTPAQGETPLPTNTPVPVATNTSVPLSTNTPVPVVTNTPVPVNTQAQGETPLPTNTPVPVATNTSVPLPILTDTPVPTATNTNTPVPTATNTNTPVPTATNTNTPVPTATNTNTPVPTATNTNTPVPTATDTATPVPTTTPTPAGISCAPGQALANASIVVNTVGDDVSGQEHGSDSGGKSWFPNGTANLTYTFNGSATAFTLNTSDVEANLPWAGGLVAANGDTSNDLPPAITRANAKQVSFIGYQPSDWAQRLARMLDGQAIGATASLPVSLSAKGALPSFLLDAVVGANPEPETEQLGLDFTIHAKRVADGLVNGIQSCRFEYTMDRPMVYDPAVLLTPGAHGSAANPLIVTEADETAAALAAHMSGFIMDQAEADSTRFYHRKLDAYFPAMKGTFATSSLVPYVPVQVYLEHTYGISSMSDPYPLSPTLGDVNNKATQPLTRPATQVFNYQP